MITGCSGLVHWDDPEGWYGEGDGRGVQDWEHVYNHGGFLLMKTNTIKKKKERKEGRLEVIDLPYRKGKEQDTSKSQVHIS